MFRFLKERVLMLWWFRWPRWWSRIRRALGLRCTEPMPCLWGPYRAVGVRWGRIRVVRVCIRCGARKPA